MRIRKTRATLRLLAPDVRARLAKYEYIHRTQIAELNETREWEHLSYFKDSRVDLEIARLVALLNNKWTVSGYAWQGHWPTPNRHGRYKLHAPGISFYVLPGKYKQWDKIQRSIFAKQEPLLPGTPVVHILTDYRLPLVHPERITWMFGSHDQRAEVEEHFGTEDAWRIAVARVIESTCQGLERAILAQPE